MKKFLAFIICMEVLSMPSYSVIVDEFTEKTLDKNLKITKQTEVEIYDSFAEQSLDKNLKIKERKYTNITDNFAENNKQKNAISSTKVSLNETIPKVTEKSVTQQKIAVINESDLIPVNIRIKKNFSTKQKIDEGDYIEFETTSDIKIKNKTYPKGTTVKARIETISQNKMWGVPSDLVIGNFSIAGNSMQGDISKVGANRSLWVYPAVYIGSWFFGAGMLLIPIRGGHAKIQTGEVFTIYAVK